VIATCDQGSCGVTVPLLIRGDESGLGRARGGGRFEGCMVAPPPCGGAATGCDRFDS